MGVNGHQWYYPYYIKHTLLIKEHCERDRLSNLVLIGLSFFSGKLWKGAFTVVTGHITWSTTSITHETLKQMKTTMRSSGVLIYIVTWI